MCKCEWEDVIFMCCMQTPVEALPEEMVLRLLSAALARNRRRPVPPFSAA